MFILSTSQHSSSAACIVYSPACPVYSPVQPVQFSGKPQWGKRPGNPFLAPIPHSTVLHCTILHCTLLHCTVLYCTVLHCTAFDCTVLYSTVLSCTVLHCTTKWWTDFTNLRCIAFYGSIVIALCISQQSSLHFAFNKSPGSSGGIWL